MKIIERIVNTLENETVDIERNETAQEKAAREQFQADQLVKQAEAEAKAAQRQAIADRLGLTPDELKLLLG